MIRFYDVTLRVALRHRLTTFLTALAVLGGSVYLFLVVPQGFIPSEDRDMLMIRTEASQGISYRSMFEHQQALAAILQKDPNVLQFMSSAGGGGGGGGSGGNTGQMLLLLKPRSERALSADEVLQELRPKLASVPGIQAFIQNPPVINLGGRSAKGLYQYTLQGPDTDELFRGASQLMDRLKNTPGLGLQDVSSDMQLQNPELNVHIDRDQASALGVSATEVESVLNNAYGSRQVSTIFAPNNDYQVIMELLPEYQLAPTALALLYVRSTLGPLVPLNAVADLKEDVGPLTINHSGQLPAVTISFNLQPGTSLSQAVDEVGKIARDTLPATVSAGFQGAAQAFQTSMNSLYLLLALAIVVIYIVLGILYENFFHPVTILSALPFAAFGAVLTLVVFHTDLSLYAFVGIIMLVGLVKKNGIMMIDFAIVLQRGGKSPADAIHEACLIRFRPIMMTTLCALMAGLPIALGWGAGAESRRPLGLAVVGGLVFSQTLTLYVTPVFYLYMESLQNLLRKWFGRRPAPVTNRARGPLMPIRAVIFDLDGVIVSTDEFHYLAWQRLADEEGILFDRHINHCLRGVSRMDSLEILLERSPRPYSQDQKVALAARKNDYYRAMLDGLSPADILPGAMEVLKGLRARGVKVAIASSSRNSPTILTRIGLAEFFDATADGNDITRSKPDPEVFLIAARRLGMDPASCLVVEDAAAGVEAAVAGGMKCLALGAAAGHPQATRSAKDLTAVTADGLITA